MKKNGVGEGRHGQPRTGRENKKAQLAADPILLCVAVADGSLGIITYPPVAHT
jgi:hypothetical protein